MKSGFYATGEVSANGRKLSTHEFYGTTLSDLQKETNWFSNAIKVSGANVFSVIKVFQVTDITKKK